MYIYFFISAMYTALPGRFSLSTWSLACLIYILKGNNTVIITAVLNASEYRT